MTKESMVIGAMKPLTRGHEQLILKAIHSNDSHTHLFLSGQDRIYKLNGKKIRASTEAFLSTLASNYFPGGFLNKGITTKPVTLNITLSEKFVTKDAKSRMPLIHQLFDSLKQSVQDSCLTAVNLLTLKSGPINIAYDTIEANQEIHYTIHSGKDDEKKYQSMINKFSNLSGKFYKRGEDTMLVSGTNARDIIFAERPNLQMLKNILPETVINHKQIVDLYLQYM